MAVSTEGVSATFNMIGWQLVHFRSESTEGVTATLKLVVWQ